MQSSPIALAATIGQPVEGVTEQLETDETTRQRSLDAEIASMEEEEQLLLKQLDVQALRARIAALQQRFRKREMVAPTANRIDEELLGAQPRRARSIGSLASSRSKRTAAQSFGSEDDDYLPDVQIRAPMLRPLPPAAYYGKNLKEHREFIRSCELVFRQAPVQYAHDETKISAVLPYAKGSAGEAFDREEERLRLNRFTWEGFVQFLLDLAEDPVNHMFTVAQQYKEARQGQNQKVMDLLTYLETLEAQLQPYTEPQKTQALLTGMREDLRAARTSQLNIPQDRLEVARLAMRLEENMRKGRKHHEEAPKQRQDRESQTPPRKSEGNQNNDRRRHRKSFKFGDQDKSAGPVTGVNRQPATGQLEFAKGITCYNCQKEGHYSNKCPDKKRIAMVGKPSQAEN